MGRDPAAARRGHDRLHHHPLPRRGRRALRPDRDHGRRPDRRRGHARRRSSARSPATSVTIGLDGRRRCEAAEVLDGQESSRRSRSSTRATGCGSTSTTARPRSRSMLRVLDGAGITIAVDRAAPAEPRRRVPHQDRPIPAGEAEPMKLLRDTWLVFQRQMLLLLRNPVWVFVGIFQPLILPAAVRAAAQAGARRVTTNAEAYRSSCRACWCCSPSSARCSGLRPDRRAAGRRDRARGSPRSSRLALLLGRSLRDVVSLLVQAAHHHGAGTARSACGSQIGDLLLAYLMLALIALMTLGGRPTRSRSSCAARTRWRRC